MAVLQCIHVTKKFDKCANYSDSNVFRKPHVTNLARDVYIITLDDDNVYSDFSVADITKCMAQEAPWKTPNAFLDKERGFIHIYTYIYIYMCIYIYI